MTLVGASSRAVGPMHDTLFQRGIYTKSMIRTYLRCPVQFERRYVYGEKEPPGWAIAIGNVMDQLFQEWGYRALQGQRLPPTEARSILASAWDEHVSRPGIRPSAKDPHPDRSDKLASLLLAYEEFLRRVPELRLGKLEQVQPAFGYEGTTLLGGVPIAGHPDFVFSSGPVDVKCVQRSSNYLRGGFWGNVVDYVFQAVLTGHKRSSMLICRHDASKDDERLQRTLHIVTESATDTVGEIVHRVAEAVKRGDFPPTAAQVIGQYPCTPTWCGYFGKTCPVTKGIKLS